MTTPDKKGMPSPSLLQFDEPFRGYKWMIVCERKATGDIEALWTATGTAVVPDRSPKIHASSTNPIDALWKALGQTK
jgi:hypothetical protein